MSKQLTLSASISVMAMAAFVLVGTPSVAAEAGYRLPLVNAMAAACTSAGLGDLLPVLQPGLQ